MKRGILIASLAGLAATTLAAGTRRSSFMTSDRVRLSYLEAGDPAAPPIVFVPGWMCPAWIWEAQIGHFSRSNHVVALDPRAQGESGKQADDLTPERRARDIGDLVHHLQLTNLTLVGWSMAVGEVLGYVEQSGTAGIRALVLVDGFVGSDLSAESIRARQNWVEGLQTNRTAFLEGFAGMFFRRPQPVAWRNRLLKDIRKTPTAAAVVLATSAALRDHRPGLSSLARASSISFIAFGPIPSNPKITSGSRLSWSNRSPAVGNPAPPRIVANRREIPISSSEIS